MVNLLVNPSFEGGWTNVDAEIQLPKFWGFSFKKGKDDNPFHDGNPWSDLVKPEMVHKSRNELPAHEHDLYIKEGDWTLKVFKGHGAWRASFIQARTLEPGTYRFSIGFFCDAVKEWVDGKKVWADDPKSCMVRFILNGELMSTWDSATPGEWNTMSMEFDAIPAMYDIQVEFLFPFALANSGIFADDWSLYKVADLIPDGGPRIQYSRTYLLLPPDADSDWAVAAAAASWDNHRYTIGGSADDAGIGALSDKEVIVVNPHKWIDLDEWMEKWYPGTRIKNLTAETPAILIEKLQAGEFDDDDEDPPPPAKEPWTYINYHTQVPTGGELEVLEMLAEAGIPMRSYKMVDTNMEMARNIKAVSPDTFVVWRKVDNNVHLYHGDRAGPARFLDTFWDSFMKNIDWIDGVESLNETIATHDLEGIKRTVEFDIWFVEELYRRVGNKVKPIILNAPPGNPDHGEEVRMLIPAVRAAVDVGGVLGPHTYWAAVPNDRTATDRWFEEEGMHFHLRPLLSWQVEFSKEGLYPKYLFGETGPVTVYVREDGRPGGFINSGAGWRVSLNGDLDWLLDMLVRYEELIKKFDIYNQVLGANFFTTGGWGWENFRFETYEWARFLERKLDDLRGNLR